MELRDYQKRAVNEVLGHWRSGKRNVCLVMPTGGGKTRTAKELVARARATGAKVVAIAHRRELVQQLLDSFGEEAAAICPGFEADPSKPIQVATVQTLLARGNRPDARMFIWDECFPSGTAIGSVSIESVRVGDEIDSFCEKTGRIVKRRVAQVFKSIPSQLVKVSINGSAVTCTPGHPFLTKNGWKPALLLSGERTGREENKASSWARVDSVEILEPGSDGRFGGMCPDGFVYNFEVEDTHTYIANGFVVHNCHHQPADAWSELMDHYRGAYSLGLTATPMRSDGKALDCYDELVVGAHYSELLKAGHLTQCRVYQPTTRLNGLATDPLDAYKAHGRGRQAFVFCANVKHCYDVAEAFDSAGISSAVIEGETDLDIRAQRIEMFRRRYLQCLMNVYCLTEGVDVPSAEVCILARSVNNTGTYMQMVGRILRPSEGKDEARLIDLSGSSLVHGMPTADRMYSLKGNAIQVASPAEQALRVCLKCGYTHSGGRKCPSCGYESLSQVKMPRIYDAALREVWAGSDTQTQAKVAELLRLRRVAWERDWSVSWVIKQYREVFYEDPCCSLFSIEEREREWIKLVRLGKERGYKKGFAFARFKSLFGTNPERSWSYG